MDRSYGHGGQRQTGDIREAVSPSDAPWKAPQTEWLRSAVDGSSAVPMGGAALWRRRIENMDWSD